MSLSPPPTESVFLKPTQAIQCGVTMKDYSMMYLALRLTNLGPQRTSLSEWSQRSATMTIFRTTSSSRMDGFASDLISTGYRRSQRSIFGKPRRPSRGVEVATGTLIAPYRLGVNHDHFFSYRIDFDIDGRANHFVRHKLEAGSTCERTQTRNLAGQSATCCQ